MIKPVAFITGGAGFVGHHLARKLSIDHEVVILDNLTTGSKENLKDITHYLKLVDVRNMDGLHAVFNEFRPQFVYHLAALARIQRSWDFPKETFDVNVTGTANILEQCRYWKVKKVMVTSSSSVFAGKSKEIQPLPIPWFFEQKPLNPYAYNKYLDEQLVRMYRDCFDLDALIVRPFNVYGEGQNYHSDYSTVIPKFAQLKAEGKPLTVYGDGCQTRDFSYVGDVTDMMIHVMRQPKDNRLWQYNLCSGEAVSLLDLAEAFNTLYQMCENPRKGEANWTWGANNTGLEAKMSVLDWVRKTYGQN